MCPVNPYADPVSSGINAFRQVSDVFMQNKRLGMEKERLGMEKERMGQESKLRDLQIQHEGLILDQAKNNIGLQHDMREEFKKFGDEGGWEAYHDGLDKSDRIAKGSKETFTPAEVEAVHTLTPAIAHIDIDHLEDQSSALAFLRNSPLTSKIMNSPQKQVVIFRGQAPNEFAALEKVYPELNSGTDKNNLSVKGDGVKKSISKILIDKTNPQMPTMSFVMSVESPVRDGQVFKHKGDGTPRFTIDPEAPGMVQQGNIDLNQRPVRRNAAGSISTVLSTNIGTIENINGKEQSVEVLLPLIDDKGNKITPDEAWEQYKKDGKHLGKFMADGLVGGETAEEHANAYAEKLHSSSIWDKDNEELSVPKGQTSTSYQAPKTLDNGPNPNAPIVRMRLPLMDYQTKAMQRHINALRTMWAQLHPDEAMKYLTGLRENRARNNAIMEAKDSLLDYMKENPEANVNVLRSKFEADVIRRYPDIDQKDLTAISKDLIQTRDVQNMIAMANLQLKGMAETNKELSRQLTEQRQDRAEAERERSNKVREKQGEERIGIEKGKLEQGQEPVVQTEEGPVIVNKKSGEGRQITVGGKPVKGKPTAAETKEKEAQVSGRVDKDNEVEDDSKDTVKNRANAILSKNSSLKIEDAVEQAKKDLKVKPNVSHVESNLKGKKKGDYRINGHLGHWNGSKFEWAD